MKYLCIFSWVFVCPCFPVLTSDLWPRHRPPEQPQQPGDQTDHQTDAEFLLVSVSDRNSHTCRCFSPAFFQRQQTFACLAECLLLRVCSRYNASDGNNSGSNQPSGAYIFRPNSSTPFIISKTAKTESIQVESGGQLDFIIFLNNSFNSQADVILYLPSRPQLCRRWDSGLLPGCLRWFVSTLTAELWSWSGQSGRCPSSECVFITYTVKQYVSR